MKIRTIEGCRIDLDPQMLDGREARPQGPAPSRAKKAVRNPEPSGTAWNDMKTFSTEGTRIDFLTEDEDPERTANAIGKELGGGGFQGEGEGGPG